MTDTGTVTRAELAEWLGMRGDDPAFLLAFSAARHALLGEGIDFRPIGGGAYRRAAPHESLQRSSRDTKAAVGKLERGRQKAQIVAASDESTPHEREAGQRRADRLGIITAHVGVIRRARRLDRIRPPRDPVRGQDGWRRES
jgi:hypothetical protein